MKMYNSIVEVIRTIHPSYKAEIQKRIALAVLLNRNYELVESDIDNEGILFRTLGLCQYRIYLLERIETLLSNAIGEYCICNDIRELRKKAINAKEKMLSLLHSHFHYKEKQNKKNYLALSIDN